MSKYIDQDYYYQSTQGSKVSSLLLETLQTIIYALAISIILYLFFVIPNQVEGKSMYPTLNSTSINDVLLTNKFVQIAGGPGHLLPDYNYQRGDMVVFRLPSEDTDLVKRVIGLPGDRVKINDGRVIVNDEVLVEEYLPAGLRTEPYTGGFFSEGLEKRVPENYYFVLGDNRKNSLDSRTTQVGFVSRELIKGTPFIRILPLDQFGLLSQGEIRAVPESEIFENN